VVIVAVVVAVHVIVYITWYICIYVYISAKNNQSTSTSGVYVLNITRLKIVMVVIIHNIIITIIE